MQADNQLSHTHANKYTSTLSLSLSLSLSHAQHTHTHTHTHLGFGSPSAGTMRIKANKTAAFWAFPLFSIGPSLSPVRPLPAHIPVVDPPEGGSGPVSVSRDVVSPDGEVPALTQLVVQCVRVQLVGAFDVPQQPSRQAEVELRGAIRHMCVRVCVCACVCILCSNAALCAR